jgi:geranylgeranyl pyrophosphate synthase
LATHASAGSGAERVLSEPLGRIEAELARFVESLPHVPRLVEAVRYSALAGGKRLRPVLAWLASEAAGGSGEDSLPAGVAVELVHAFSLVHDDLPAMDDDDLRRGKPTLHIHAGEAMAILAGDAMLALAFRALQGVDTPSLSGRLTAELVAGTMGMIDGQVLDTLGGFDEHEPPARRVRRVHESKTGALIRASVRMGAMCAAADGPASEEEAVLAPLTRYAEAVGLMFQIVDDLLDVTGTPEQTGKRTNKDAELGKLTYPSVFGVDESRAEALRLRDEAVDAARSLGDAGDPLASVAEWLAERSS